MKSLYVPLAILSIVLLFSLWSGRYVHRETDRWSKSLEKAEELAQAEDWDTALGQLQQTHESWMKASGFLHTIIEHNELDDAELLFVGAIAACQEWDNEDFHIMISQLAEQLHHLAETQALSIRNIL